MDRTTDKFNIGKLAYWGQYLFKKHLAALILLGISISSPATDIAIWGNGGKLWSNELANEGVKITLQVPQKPPSTGEFKNYQLVMLVNSSNRGIALTNEDIDNIRTYIRDGGILYAEGGNAALLAEKGSYAQTQDIVGAQMYYYGAAEVSTVPKWEKLLETSGKIEFFKTRMPYLGKITTGEFLQTDGKNNAWLMVNRAGKGAFVFSSATIFNMTQQPEIKKGIVNLLELIIKDGIKSFTIAPSDFKGEIPAISSPAAKTNGSSNDAITVSGKIFNLIISGSDKAAIKFLSQKLQEITGQTDFTTPRENSITIAVGTSLPELGKMHPYGYVMQFKDNKNIILSGSQATGTMYAVNDFLKRFAGYRKFGGASLQEIIPARRSVTIPASFDFKEEPSISSYTVAWLPNYYFGRNVRVCVPGGHTLDKIIPVDKYGETNPEYYPMIDGKRIKLKTKATGAWQPCLANPKLLELSMIYADNYLKKNPSMLSIPFGVNDGGGDCQCEYCVGQLTKYGNQYANYYNELAKEIKKCHPDKLVSFYAYGRCASAAPAGIRMENNLLPEITAGLANNMQLMREWKKTGVGYMGLYDYLYTCGSRRFIVPRYYPRTMVNAWRKAAADYHLSSIYMEVYPDTFIFEAPRQYVLDEIAWNINANVEVLLDDYFSSMYAEAAVPVKAAFDRLEEVYNRAKETLNPIMDSSRFVQSENYTFADLKYMDDKFAAAAKLVHDVKAKARLAILLKFYNFIRDNIEVHICARELSEADPDKIIPLINQALAAIQRCDNFKLSPDEDKEIFCGKHSLAEYRKIAVLRPDIFLEGFVDNALSKMDKDETFWRQQAELTKNEKLKSWFLTQIYKKKNKEINLVKNPSFEVSSNPDVSKWTRKEISSQMSWATWHFQNSVTAFVVDDKDAHSGKYCVGIGENQIAGCLQLTAKLDPGCRYRLSFYVKRNYIKPLEDSMGRLNVRFKDANGKWADEGASQHPAGAIKLEYPPECVGKWVKLEVTFSGLPGSDPSYLSALFSAPRQGTDARLWFDDIELTKIYDPFFFGQK